MRSSLQDEGTEVTPIVELASHRSIPITELDARSGGPLSLFGALHK